MLNFNIGQQLKINGFVGKLVRGLPREKAKMIRAGINELDGDRLTSAIDRLNGASDKDQKIGPALEIYSQIGVGHVLRRAELDDFERQEAVNRMSGEKLVDIYQGRGVER